LIEVMIGTLLLGMLGVMIAEVLASTSRWDSTAYARDTLAEDVAAVWKTFNEDLGQSLWYLPDTSQPFATAALESDRKLFYAPYIVQPALVAGGDDGATARHELLKIFNRAGGEDIRFGPVAINGISARDLTSALPGLLSDAGHNPADAVFTEVPYQASYFARCQELVFVRSSTTSWDQQQDLPREIGTLSPGAIPAPAEPFGRGEGGTTTAWNTQDNHAAIGVLHPLGFEPVVTGGVTTWRERTPGEPYGRVMESAVLDPSATTITLLPQLEQDQQPTFQPVEARHVRLLGYQLVPSPTGAGRLVRTYVVRAPDSEPTRGTEPGQWIAKDGDDYLVVDRVLSEHVVRVLFETARHQDDLGINNIRATVFFAKAVERDKQQALIVRRSVTMLFAMRGANSPADKENARLVVKTRAEVGTGSIPFSY
jgi:hypothetical protein